jgi:TubC N-terminal docking domain
MMTAAELLASLRRRGVEFVAVGDKVRWRPKAGVTTEEHGMIVSHKAEVIEILSASNQGQSPPAQPDHWHRWDAVVWPPACLEAERLFGQRHARLFPLLGHKYKPPGRVHTTLGPGFLLAVSAVRTQVALQDDPKGAAAALAPWEVWPA